MGVTWKKVEKNIYQCAENPGKYKIILYFGRDERNKLISSSKVIEGNLTDARKILKLHEAELVKKTVQKPTKITLQELLDNWNSNIGDVQNVETTQASTRNLQRHMLEYFGDIWVDKIDTSLIRKYMAYLKKEKGLSSKTVNKHRTHLHTLFDYMISEEEIYGIYKNPVDSIKPYPVEEFNHEIYSPDEAKELLIALRESGRYDLEVAVNLAFWCGCRREETCALEWHNVDLENREIKICQVRTTAKGNVVERKSTKNKEIRVVGIPDWLFDCLMRVKKRQQQMKELLQEEYFSERDYVFCHDNGKPWNPNSLSNQYKDFLEKNNFKHIRYHDLRHTNLSMLMTKMSAVDVAKIGGHKQVSTTTNIYGHSFDDSVERGKETMNDIMGEILEKDDSNSMVVEVITVGKKRS